MPRRKLKPRADGRYQINVYVGRDDTGKQFYKTIYGSTAKEVEEKAQQLKVAMHKGIDVNAKMDTFEDWAEKWLKIKKSEVKGGQYAAYKAAVDSWNTRIGNAEISKLRTIDFQDALIDLAEKNDNTGKPSSKKTLLNRRITAAGIMQLAVDNRVLEYNPVAATRMPKTKLPRKRRALLEHEQKWICDLEHDARPAAMIMMYAGLRRGEMIPLTWDDIDLAKGIISVNKSAECVRGKFVLHQDSAKTAESIREVHIPKRLVDFLKGETRSGALVTTSKKGTLHTESSWIRLWESYLADLNFEYGVKESELRKENGREYTSKFDPDGVPFVIPRITPHWLRHTFATLLYLSGVDVLTAMKQLGHTDVKTTLSIYTHLDKVYKAKSMTKLDTYLEDQEKDEDDAEMDGFLENTSQILVIEDYEMPDA
ncbi:site-specific integrase [Eubacteriales bacterium OttesenSCG-928-N13]|nr:site-specific integrase [Eubacteriales bacterium OttesenSCG-928-N13]